ncbi:polysaccharide biosynthesis protein [Ideonella sp. B7]|uniref:polysaccharide biosynthesis protein n=1 Tax=Ideonella benzenivorans TaxID=2831643 RepID=UPI001CEDD6A7|nr:nucleoside-diphosphate sugar epimerase/dehydratase [Ideonella benzenivorans]MCA6216851.1 polysaccharide biosynthesis protein [Ideonella benzenivorans]
MNTPSSSVWHRLDRFLARLRPHRVPLSLAIDAGMVVVAWHATYLFRMGFERWLHERPPYDLWVLVGVVVVYLSAFVALRVPQGMWRFSGFGEIKRLTLACLVAGVVSAAGTMGLQLYGVPRAVLALHPFVVLMAVSGVRLLYRALYEHARARISGEAGPEKRALVLGAGEAAKRLLAGIQHQGWVVLGLLDDDPAKQGARIAGVPVLGPLTAVKDPGVRGDVTHLIIALPAATSAQRRRAVELAGATGLPVLTVPSAEELQRGDQVNRVRDIEPEDLLGREPVQLDENGIGEVLRGKTVLVTGGGGSIGSELCRQVARYQPARLVVVELSEFNLYTIEQDLALRFPQLEVLKLIGDVKDLEGLRAIFQRTKPQVVFHAAAYKHVPLMEVDNAWAALRNNTLGTYHAALAAAEAGVERFVLISTDKAVNPTNVMGATKRAAELVISAMATKHQGTRFMAVRFGNVLGSSGSVIPKFKEQIARGGPITVTHPEIIRYFMTIPEAARLVVQAAAIGESGQVLVLDMGEPVKIVDLARDMIRLAGRTEQDIRVEYTGLRPGEKLYEELLASSDTTLPTRIERLFVAKLDDGVTSIRVGPWLMKADSLGRHPSDDTIRQLLSELIVEYRQPSSGTRQ